MAMDRALLSLATTGRHSPSNPVGYPGCGSVLMLHTNTADSCRHAAHAQDADDDICQPYMAAIQRGTDTHYG
jgi:hypothetical protein